MEGVVVKRVKRTRETAEMGAAFQKWRKATFADIHTARSNLGLSRLEIDSIEDGRAVFVDETTHSIEKAAAEVDVPRSTRPTP